MGAPKRVRLCRACGKPVGSFGVCEHCGAWPSVDRWLVSPSNWPSYIAVVALFILAVIAIGAYALSEAGQARLLELALVVVGPILLFGVAWLAYRSWYRRRYPDE